jgi:hypothetical protein
MRPAAEARRRRRAAKATKPAGKQRSQRTSSDSIAGRSHPHEQVELAAIAAVRTAPAACVCMLEGDLRWRSSVGGSCSNEEDGDGGVMGVIKCWVYRDLDAVLHVGLSKHRC